jgi:hypothetical protein
VKESSVNILILNWNGKEVLKKCLSSLLKLTEYKNFKVIVVDNASTDSSVDMVKSEFKNVDLLENKENLGFIRGNNIGIRYALEKYNPDYVLLLNNDTKIVQKDWLKRLVDIAESDKKIGLIGCKLIFPDGRIQWAGRRRETSALYLILQTLSASLNPGIGMNKKESSFTGEVNTVSGACMMIKSELIKKIGLLDESLSLFFQEDVEYSFRAWKYGWKVAYVGTSSVIHLQSYSFEKRKITDEKLYLALRNSIIVSKKYFGVMKTLFIGLPIVSLTAIFERKDKTRPFSLGNLKIRDKLFSKVLILLKVVRYIIKKVM